MKLDIKEEERYVIETALLGYEANIVSRKRKTIHSERILFIIHRIQEKIK